MARGVSQLCAPRENRKYFCWFFLLSLFPVTKDIAVAIAVLCSSKNKLSAAGESADVLVRFLKNKKYQVDAPGQRPAGGTVCARAPRVALAGSSSFPGSWMGLCLRHPAAVPLSPALPEAGRKEGAAGRTLATKGCQALQSYPDLCVRAWILTFSLLLGLGFAAGLSGWGEWSWPGCMQSLDINPCIIFKYLIL